MINAAHLHLLLNHVPTVGTVFAVGLLVVSMVRRSRALQEAGFEALFLITVLTLPAYVSGVAARAGLLEGGTASEAAIDAHHDAAFVAFVGMQATGFAAWLALWRRRRGHQARRAPIVVLGLSGATLGLMTAAALAGGGIGHPEIGMPQPSGSGAGWIRVAGITTFINDTPWVWPAAETVHFIGMSLLFGVLAFASVRVIGFMKGVPFAAVHRLLPWAALGFALNTATGMLFVLGSSAQYVGNPPFYWKIALLVPAGASVLYLTVSDAAWGLKAGEDARIPQKAIAASVVCLLAMVMYFGRMLPFIGTSF